MQYVHKNCAHCSLLNFQIETKFEVECEQDPAALVSELIKNKLVRIHFLEWPISICQVFKNNFKKSLEEGSHDGSQEKRTDNW